MLLFQVKQLHLARYCSRESDCTLNLIVQVSIIAYCMLLFQIRAIAKCILLFKLDSMQIQSEKSQSQLTLRNGFWNS